MSFSCSVYGLGVDVNVPIAGLAGLQAPSRVDVRMSLGALPTTFEAILDDEWREYYVSRELGPHGEPTIRVSRPPGADCFRIEYLDGTVIAVDAQGSRVWATWPANATVEDTATYLLGPTLGFVLRLRGFTCLHGSAVAIGGRAVAFVGPSGSGKSTTAAAFAQLGYPVLTDDVLALVDEGERFKVQPAYPRIRLWPRSVESLFGSVEALPRITPTWDKRFLDLNGARFRFQREPLQLAAIYFLGDRDGYPGPPRVDDVGPRAGLMALISDTYTTYLLDRRMRASEFELLGRLVGSVPLRRVTASADCSRIAQMCETILGDLERAAPHV
jgi:energy-coupling factor transporter ATP-binding protein EcfA2